MRSTSFITIAFVAGAASSVLAAPTGSSAVLGKRGVIDYFQKTMVDYALPAIKEHGLAGPEESLGVLHYMASKGNAVAAEALNKAVDDEKALVRAGGQPAQGQLAQIIRTSHERLGGFKAVKTKWSTAKKVAVGATVAVSGLIGIDIIDKMIQRHKGPGSPFTEQDMKDMIEFAQQNPAQYPGMLKVILGGQNVTRKQKDEFLVANPNVGAGVGTDSAVVVAATTATAVAQKRSLMDLD